MKDSLEMQISAAQVRLEALLNRRVSTSEHQALFSEMAEELSVNMHELQVAAEELQQQNDELIATRQELEAERMRYQELFELAPDGYLITDARGIVRETNHAAASLLNIRADFLVGKPLGAFIAKEEHRNFRIKLAQLRKQEKLQWEMHMQPRQGIGFIAALTVSAVSSRGKPSLLRWSIQDITERRKTEEAIKKERDRAQRYLDIAGVIIVAIDTDQKVSLINKKGCEILGYEEHDIVEKNWFDSFFPGRIRDDMKALFEKAIAGEFKLNGYYDDVPVLTNNGEEKIIAWNNVLLKDEFGRITGTLSSGEDVTEQRRIEEDIKRANMKVNNILESISDGFMALDSNWHFTYINHRAARDGGFKPNDLINQNIWEKFPQLIGTDLEISYLKAMDERIPVHFEFNGAYQNKWYDINIYPSSEGLSIYWLDITKRKHAEKERERLTKEILRKQTHKENLTTLLRKERDILNIIMENSGTQIAYLDPKFNFIRVNSAYAKGSGHTKKELLGHSYFELFPDAENRAMFEKVRDKGEAVGFKAKPFESRDGGIIYWDWMLTPVKDSEGHVNGLVLSLADVTEYKKMEELSLENERLMSANKARTEFLAIMSHELRTPLTSVIGYSIILNEMAHGRLNEKQKFYVDNILKSSEHLLSLINGILDLAKLEARKIELLIEDISVPDAINEIFYLIKENAAERNIVLKKELDPSLENINADRQKFKQIMFNLLSNALKFSKEEGGTVTVSTKRLENMAQISVSDTGIGIKETDLPRLFHKFEQLNAGIARKYDGTGLGLAITKQLVELHGGKITVESRHGEGSTFTFLLPC